MALFNLSKANDEIRDRTEFSITNKGEFSVVCYRVETQSTFTNTDGSVNQIRSNLRGTCFSNNTGEIIRLPFEKFFNVHQKEFTQPEFLDTHKTVSAVTTKLDGTMIAPLMSTQGIFWGTKRCCQEYHDFITESGIVTPELESFVLECLESNKTPIFEYHDPALCGTCIVIQYDKRFMKLLAVRDMSTGDYVPLDTLTPPEENQSDPSEFKELRSIRECMSEVLHTENDEGVVVEFVDGSRVKLKTFWYCELHKMIDFFNTPWMMKKMYLKYLAFDGAHSAYTTVEDVLLWSPDIQGDDVMSNASDTQLAKFDVCIGECNTTISCLDDKVTRLLSCVNTKKDMGLGELFYGKDVAFKSFNHPEESRANVIRFLLNNCYTSAKNHRESAELFSKMFNIGTTHDE